MFLKKGRSEISDTLTLEIEQMYKLHNALTRYMNVIRAFNYFHL